jgi:hypothetical protein
MLTRREALCHAMSLPLLGGIPSARASSASPFRRPMTAVVDRNLSDAFRMTARLGAFSTRLHLFAGDPGRVWMNTIEPALRVEPLTLAGFTSAATLFCLHYLARDYGLELVARAEGPVSLERISTGPPGLLDLRASRSGEPEATFTWVLAPKGG